jgi:hypothetical protein
VERLDAVVVGAGQAGLATSYFLSKAGRSHVVVPVLDDGGLPVHRDGVAGEPSVYFVGFPWLRARRSGVLLGVGADAEHVATELGRFLDG